MKDDYWMKFWNSNPIIHSEDPQQQVARTVNKVPIAEELWNFTLSEIERILELRPEDTLLDLGAGNGVMSKPFSKKCRSVTSVDFSSVLLSRINKDQFPNITIVISDIRNVQFAEGAFTKGVMYSVLQHFSEKETVRMFESFHAWLAPGGIFLIGDIPDVDRRWAYFNSPQREKAYFDSVRHDTPIIGTWFKRDFLEILARHIGFSECRILDEDPKLINAHYRFDVRLVK